MPIRNYRKIPRENLAEMIKKWGLLKNMTIEPPNGIINLWADLAEGRMSLSVLYFNRGRNKTEEMKKFFGKTEEEMKKALEFLRYGEPYESPFEQIREGKPYPSHWSSKGRYQKDCWRFGIELYNALALEYQQKGLNIMPLIIQEGKLTTIKDLEKISLESASL